MNDPFASKIEARLDLHGLTQTEAHEQLVQFIERAVEQGKRHLLIITGIGKGVLKEAVPLWLDAPKLRRHIAATGPASIEKGGKGALHVLLKKPDGPGRRSS